MQKLHDPGFKQFIGVIMTKYYYAPSIRIEANIEVSTLEQMGWKNYLGVHDDTRLVDEQIN